MSSNWGSQNYSQIMLVTDLGTGIGKNSLKNLINGSGIAPHETLPLPLGCPSKFSVMCLGNSDDDPGFKYGMNLYQQLLDVSKQKGQLFVPRVSDKTLNERCIVKMFKQMCEVNYKPFEAVLNMGSYFKLESPVSLFPEPFPYSTKDAFGIETTRMISKRIEVCGYIKISDIVGSGGTPASISRHIVFPRIDNSTSQKKTQTELEKLESDMKHFFAKSAQEEDESSSSTSHIDQTTKESACVLLHGALKVEGMAALVLLAEDWYGFLYSYADKKKSNLLLSILPSGCNVVPWMGDFRYLGLVNDALPGESYGFPVKTEKKSYSSSSNIISWIRDSALQADIQKILRHAKKIPEKGPTSFYKELNRIRRNAQSLGFTELIDLLADIFDKEIQQAQPNSEMTIQLKHAANELRRSEREIIKKFES
jgi:hypothetical protein